MLSLPRSQGRDGCIVVFAAWLICVLLAGFNLSFTIIYQELVQRYNGTATETAWVLALYGTVRMFSSPVVSVLSNMYSHRTVTLVGSFINSAAMIASAYAPSLKVLYFTFGIIGGFGSNMVYHPPFPAIGYFFDRRRGLAMAVASTGCGIGGVVMAPVIELLFREYGYSGAMLVIAGIMLNCCVASMLLFPVSDINKVMRTQHYSADQASVYGSLGNFGSFIVLDKRTSAPGSETDHGLHETEHENGLLPNHADIPNSSEAMRQSSLQIPSNHKTRNESNSKKADADASDTFCRNQKFRRVARSVSIQFALPLLQQTDFVLLCVMMTGYYLCFATTNTFLSGIALNIGFSQSQVALMLTISYALDTPSRLLAGLLLDVPFLRSYHTPMIACFSLLAALTAILLPLATTITGLFILWAVYQFLFNGIQVQQVPLTVEIVGMDKAMGAVGLARVFMGIGEISGPIIGGVIKDTTGSYEFAFYYAGCAFIVTCLILLAHNIMTRVGSCRQDSSRPTCEVAKV